MKKKISKLQEEKEQMDKITSLTSIVLKKSKMLISMLLVLFIVFSLTSKAFALPNRASDNATYRTSLLDGEKKENVFIINVISKGNVKVDHYIDGVFYGTATASTKDGYLVNGVFDDAKTKAKTEYSLNCFAENDNHIDSQMPLETEISANQMFSILSYSFVGTITYKPFYDTLGNLYNEKLNIYLQAGSERSEYRTLNVGAGYAAALAVAAIAAVLTVFCPPLAVVASDLLGALAIAAGTAIIGGIIQGAISKTYYTKILPYDIKAIDPATGRNNYYTGERCYSAVNGSGSTIIWSSSYYFNGYLPWNSANVAYWLFGDFWSFPYPGTL